ncbi:respiratory nitrate reductase subunit gamma [Cytobacillus sp. FJAT-54145]|uniref:Respiratory nitrate reductase subunit gamma n=1 Tax=Cytobacillus spartinae TaxID=3299023 RepID=A0ABW6K840_9BACI
MFHIILWIIYPYSVVAILGMGIVWQIDATKIHEEHCSIMEENPILRRTVWSLMTLSILSGIGVVIFYSISDEPLRLFHWVVSLIALAPDMELIKNISYLSRIHLMLLLTFLLMLSFSRQISYFLRPHRYFKKYILKRSS